jgi:hypothetical protein
MYCSTCGAAVAHSLIYCNQCGAKLRAGKADDYNAPELPPRTLVNAMMLTFIFGLAAIITLLSVLKKIDLNEGMANAIVLLSFLILLALEGVFTWLLLSRTKVQKGVSQTSQLSEQTIKELYAPPARVIAEPVPSVIEQTTNQLEPIYREQKSK